MKSENKKAQRGSWITTSMEIIAMAHYLFPSPLFFTKGWGGGAGSRLVEGTPSLVQARVGLFQPP